MSPSLLFFTKGGYSNGRIKADCRDTAFPADNVSDGANCNGFHAGFGVEAKVGKAGYVKAEYVRTNYQNFRHVEEETTLKTNRDQGVVGFGLRF